MFQSLYIEEEIQDHPTVKRLCERFPNLPTILCERYTEIFNRKAQNFRLQKQNPSLILAKKHGNFVLETPPNYGIGGKNNYYFSHLYNCIYDCRYCFLQGMYRSANYVFFVNFEDFYEAIMEKMEESVYFFSGYDCDSLALESITGFAKNFIPLFESNPKSYLELRTKSLNVQGLLKREPMQNCIIAYTLTPKKIAEALEHKAPPLHRRLEALVKLQQKGWPIGLRFDPLIYSDDYKEMYRSFFRQVFEQISQVHSVTLGPFRLPKGFHQKMQQLYPEEKLFAHSLKEKDGMVSYHQEVDLVTFCKNELLSYIPEEKMFCYEDFSHRSK